MKYLLLALSFVLFANMAEAKVWKINYPASKLSFTGTQTKAPFTGTFGAYEAMIDMDPALPAQAKIDVTIDMASAKTGDAQRDQALPGADWFDVKTFPKATFHVTKLTETKGPDATQTARHFTAEAELTIKGVKKTVQLPFTLEPYMQGMRAKGEVTVDRTQYNVGMGEWASDVYVGKPVTISLDIVAQ